jgi:hypothetical protein
MFAEGEGTLIDIATPIIRSHYGLRGLQDGPHDVPDIAWNPTRWFRTREGVTVFVEASPDILVPQIVDLNHSQALQAVEPISVLIICSERAYSSVELKQKEKKKDQGYGIMVVDRSNTAVVETWGKPLIQVIPRSEFNAHVQAARQNSRLTEVLKERLQHAYDRYRDDSISGVRAISELVEAVGTRLHEELIKPHSNSFISFATRMNKLIDDKRFRSQRAALAGARNYVETRNAASHPPKGRRQRYERVQMAKTNFLNGTKHACELYRAARALKASGNI